MATVSAALRHVKEHLDCLVPTHIIDQHCQELGHRFRDRLLNPAITVQLFVLQLLSNVALTGLRHVSGLTVSAQAICAARMRLPLQLLMKLVSASASPAGAGGLVATGWRGLRVFIADGMSFMTADTPELAKRYGKARNHKGVGFGYPNPKLLALMDLAGGFIHKVIALPWHRQEFTCLSRLFAAIGKDALLLGDRGLVSFTHLAMLAQRQIAGCFRLPRGMVLLAGGRRRRKGKQSSRVKTRSRRTAVRRQRIRQLGRQDMLVRWRAGQRPRWISQKRWAPLAQMELTLRQIAFRVTRPGFRTQWAWIITTLTDPQQCPAQELIDLYSKRWQIEVHFRDLKRTLGLSLISAKTLAGVRKEVLAFVLLYNLIRRVMAEAARRQNVPADRISFVDTLRSLLWHATAADPPVLLINPKRRRRSPARRIKAGRHRFPQLNGSRSATSKPAYTAKL